MPTNASRLPPTCRSTSAILAVPGSAAQTRIQTDCCVSTSREEPTSRVSPRATSTASPCGSINVRERPWASKRQPINYERCCADRLNSQAGSGPSFADDMVGGRSVRHPRLCHHSHDYFPLCRLRTLYQIDAQHL